MTRIPALGPRGEGWVVLQLILILATAVLGALALPAVVATWPAGWPFVLQGAILLGIGGASVVLGVRGLGRTLSALPRPRDDATLVDDGIYGRIRHPIYAGIMALGLGWALLTLSIPALVVACGLAGVLDLKARREEEWLTESFPEYRDYRTLTKRFVPGVY